MMLLCIYAVIFALLSGCMGQEQPAIKLRSGPVRGHHKQSYGGRTVAAFEGIPYAKPPIGDLRFAEPQPPEPWDGVWDATQLHTCLQFGWLNNMVIGSEDCLYINVYVPKEKPVPNENLDVIVHIHGGAFMIGNTELGGPDFIIDRDVVYVNFNYRLGPLGFLSTEDDVVPGNNGLKDQVLALKWIQENIAQFGGNPDSVTITGLSAGAGSVHLHYFSPLSKGLFHRGISQSGTAISPWAIQKAPLRRAKKLGAVVGCDQSNNKDLIECLRQRSAHHILENMQKVYVLPKVPTVLFGPSLEVKSKTAFLTEHPFKLLSEGNVQDLPWISSATSDEGVLGITIIGQVLDKVENEWEELAPYLFEYDALPKAERSSISQKIKQFYFNSEKISPETIPQMIKLFGDRLFTLDAERAARMQSKVNKSPVYSYIYGYKSALSRECERVIFKMDSSLGVGHGEDGNIVYNIRFNNIGFLTGNLTESDATIKDLLVNGFATFAKNGRPDIEGIPWEQVSNAGDFGYLSIKGPGDVKMVYEKEIAPTEFWRSLSISDKVEHDNDEL